MTNTIPLGQAAKMVRHQDETPPSKLHRFSALLGEITRINNSAVLPNRVASESRTMHDPTNANENRLAHVDNVQPAAVTAENNNQTIEKRLTDWVDAGPANENTDRDRVKQAILKANPSFNDNGQICVGGYLYFSDCSSLTALPEHLSVGGDLCLNYCSSLTALPNNLSVGGCLYLNGCTSLTVLPEHLSVGGDLSLNGCTSLTDLPDHLSVGGDLYLRGCTSLIALPNHLSVGGVLSLRGCTSLTVLPDHLSVGGDLSLSGCRSLTDLPDHLSVGGDLYLNYCSGLTALPNHLRVGGSLNLEDCTSLTDLPDHLSVGGYLDLRGCTSLIALPNHLSVGGHLFLRGCTSLTDLPDHLRVGGSLFLENCTSLTDLPDHLSVGVSLILENCTSLTDLPNHLSVGGDLSLRRCTSLTALPAEIVNLGPLPDGSPRIIDLTGTGLSEAVLSRLRASDHPGIRFNYGHAAAAHTQYATLAEAINSWVESETTQLLQPDNWGLNASQKTDLQTFLSRLHQTADAKNQNSRPQLQARIVAFLHLLQNNPHAFRDTAMDQIHHGLTSCDDRVILVMNNIEMMTRIQTARTAADPAAALKQLAKSLLALEVVHRHAAVKCASMGFVDPIEVYLAFEIKLKDALALPVSTQHMLYERCAGLTDDDINNAQHEAMTTLDNEDNITTYLNQWEPWQQFQRGQQAGNLHWSNMETAQSTFQLNDRCVISFVELNEINNPVCIGKALYDLESFLTHWIEKGTNPMTNQQLGLAELRKVEK